MQWVRLSSFILVAGVYLIWPVSKAQAQEGKAAPWATLVKEADGSFDKFLNSLLESAAPDADVFKQAARAAQALDKMFVKHAFPPLTGRGGDSGGPFQDFEAYLKRHKPVFISSPLKKKESFHSPPCLARCPAFSAKTISACIVLSAGNVNINDSGGSLIISGGDVNVSMGISESMIIAAGDVHLGSRAGHSYRGFIIAGGTVTLSSRAGELLIVSPRKVQEKDSARIIGRVVKWEMSAKPAKELFKFQTFASYKITCDLDKGQIKIQNIVPGSPADKCFKIRDIILARKGEKIESAGHFRRLLAHSLEVGEFDFEVEREGKTVRIQEKVKKEKGG